MTDFEFIVHARGLSKVFGEGATRVAALDGIDLDIGRGEFVAVMGPSGSGKSTLLHLVGGLARASSGRLLIDGRDLEQLDDDELTRLRRLRIGFVFQAFNLLDVLTARENVALPLLIDGRDERAAGERAAAALDEVGLGGRSEHLPGELSGGERQRVAIARALITGPALLLADEPTGNLDSVNGEAVMTILRRLADDRGQTILMVTHDRAHADRADRTVHMRDGRLDVRPAGPVPR